jgi:hypothetical protein
MMIGPKRPEQESFGDDTAIEPLWKPTKRFSHVELTASSVPFIQWSPDSSRTSLRRVYTGQEGKYNSKSFAAFIDAKAVSKVMQVAQADCSSTDLPVTYKLTGQIQTEYRKALAGVLLTIDPPVAAEAVSDGGGQYVFQGLQGATYMIRPEKAGYAFDPTEMMVVGDRNGSGQNFVTKKEARGTR